MLPIMPCPYDGEGSKRFQAQGRTRLTLRHHESAVRNLVDDSYGFEYEPNARLIGG